MTDRTIDEAHVRATLRAVAEATPVTASPFAPGRVGTASTRWGRRAVAVAAAVAVAVGSAVALARVDRSRTEVTTSATEPAVSPTASPLPAGFDITTASPVFSSDGEPDEVVQAYLRDRFPDHPTPGVAAAPATVAGGTAEARWSTGDSGGQLAVGTVHLRRAGARWAVIATTTDDVDLSEVVYDGERVKGTIRSSDDDSLFADVLDWRGEPVRHAPRPKGQPDAAYRFGTAAGPAHHELAIDVRAPGEPTVLRVNHVGGTILSIAEVRFEPARTPSHHDTAACERSLTTDDKEPPPDVITRRCLASLDGRILGSGNAGDRVWELVASDEPTGHWVSLRSRDQIGVFRLQRGAPWPTTTVMSTSGDRGAAGRTPFLEVGACCAMGDHIAIIGAFHPDVERIRVRLGDGRTVEASLAADDGTGYAVVVLPDRYQQLGPAEVSVRWEGDTEWSDPVAEVGLAVLGG